MQRAEGLLKGTESTRNLSEDGSKEKNMLADSVPAVPANGKPNDRFFQELDIDDWKLQEGG